MGYFTGGGRGGGGGGAGGGGAGGGTGAGGGAGGGAEAGGGERGVSEDYTVPTYPGGKLQTEAAKKCIFQVSSLPALARANSDACCVMCCVLCICSCCRLTKEVG